MRWPEKIQANSENDGMMHITDLFNTFATLAGASLDQERPLDGKNMTNLLFSESMSPRDEIIFEVSGSVRFPAIRKGKYKLIGKELYDLISQVSFIGFLWDINEYEAKKYWSIIYNIFTYFNID